MEIVKQKRRQVSLLLVFSLLAGGVPMGKEKISQAAQQNIQSPHINQSVQEIPPQSEKKTELKNPTVSNDGVTTWDCIWFGNYWQEDTNGDGKADEKDQKTPIKWRVLSVEGDDVFLMADKNLDYQKYVDTETSVTWDTSRMRSWLNGYGAEANKDGKDYSDNNFLNHAFSADEQSAIQTVNVVNNDNPVFGTEGGNDTIDKVYLLSIDEVTNVEYGFASSGYDHAESRRAKNTAFTKGKGAWTSSGAYDGYGEEAGNGDWWLRSPGYDSTFVFKVSTVGTANPSGNYVHSNVAARPALHLNLSSLSSWSYAGTVTSSVSVKAAMGKVSSLKIKQKKGTVTASWKKTAGVKGYQICYSTSKKWKGKKQKLISKNKAVIKKLKKKKTYYFRVRAYRLEGTKKVYGAWSSVKRIKIRK